MEVEGTYNSKYKSNNTLVAFLVLIIFILLGVCALLRLDSIKNNRCEVCPKCEKVSTHK